MAIIVRPGSIQEAIYIQDQIPEFVNAYRQGEYESRLYGRESVILVAEEDGQVVGFKAGYDRYEDGQIFYSWMGGVHPQYRHRGIAKLLLQKMELWCRLKGFQMLRFKTLNQHKSMIGFAASQNFNIVEFEKSANDLESVIYFQKML